MVALDRFGLRKLVWRCRLPVEVSHWDNWLRTRGMDHPEDFTQRTTPDSPLQEHLRKLLPESAGRACRILDMGAGPLSTVGKVYDGRRVDLVCIDPLARVYDALLEANGVAPPVRTEYGEAERVAEAFGENSFDLAHASKSLDHVYDPVRAVMAAVRVVRGGGFVYLEHSLRAEELESYGGLHQWIFAEEAGSFVMTSRGGRTDVTKALAGVAQVTCQVDGDAIVVHIRKLAKGDDGGFP